LLFQVLDANRDCVGYFARNKINSTTELPPQGSTWEYSAHLGSGKYEIARIYANGATITDVCPEHMKADWEKIKETLKSCLKAFNTANLSLKDNCFYDVLPEYFLYQYLEAKNQVTKHVLENIEKPENYDHMFNLVRMLGDISSRHLNVDIQPIKHLLSSVKGINFHKTLRSSNWVCDYNPWGTVTGRLSTKPNSFPILTMGKEFRPCIKPTNDWLFELDLMLLNFVFFWLSQEKSSLKTIFTTSTLKESLIIRSLVMKPKQKRLLGFILRVKTQS